MFVSDKDKFIFFHTPKVAGSSIHIFFKDHYGLTGVDRADPPPLIHHMSAKKFLDNNPNKKDYFKFAFVRNPFDRFVSAYSDFTQIRNLNLTSFKDFCKSFPNSEFSGDIHWIPQHKLLCDDETIVPDFIGRYENISDDLKKISNIIGFNIDIDHHRKTKRKSYKDTYDDESREIIQDFFSKDLELFEYLF